MGIQNSVGEKDKMRFFHSGFGVFLNKPMCKSYIPICHEAQHHFEHSENYILCLQTFNGVMLMA